MKKNILIASLFLFTTTLMAQGTIQGFTVSPASPTTADYVKVYVDLMFSSGGCAVTNQGAYTKGNYSDGWALHCLGMLAFICTSTDTFNLGYLQAGNHSFRFTLNTGFGGPNCTAGIVPDDIDSTHFLVSLATGINDIEFISENVVVYPNPSAQVVNVKINPALKINNAELKIMDYTGKAVKIISGINSNDIIFERNELANGIYFYQLTGSDKMKVNGKFVLN